MSRDQRPGKVRVISISQPPENRMRRAGDGAPDTTAPIEVVEQRPEPGRRLSRSFALLFLVACAVGGAGFAAFVPAF